MINSTGFDKLIKSTFLRMSKSSGNKHKPLSAFEDSLRIKNLRKKVELLRNKSKADEKKIKCLQARLRRILVKKGKLGMQKGLPLDASGAKSASKRRREESELDTVYPDTHVSETGEGSITRIKFEDDIDETMEIKIEPETMDEGSTADTVLEGPSTATIDDNGLNEDMIYYTEVKTEVQDDPLMEDDSASLQTPLAVALKPCDEGFVPARSHTLPRVGSLAVADFLATARRHHEREALLAVTKQPIEELNDSIGFVQLRRADDTCVVKCTVASRTVEHKCELTYDETDDAVLNCTCECQQLGCLHLLAMLVWLHSKMDCPGDMSYWSEPMVRLPRAMTLKQMYGIPERPHKIDNTVLEQFLSMCQEAQNFSPGIMRYYCEDERTKCSLHKLACKFSGVRGRGAGDAGSFLAFCRDHITAKDCEIAERETQKSLEIKREILYGRIDEGVACEITKVPPGDVEAIVETILYPDDEQKQDDIPAMVIEVLEKTMNNKITKSGTLIDPMTPIFAVTPYGTTPTHVIQIKKLDNAATIDKNRKLTMLETTSVQLQMYFAKKDFGYMCVFKDLNLDVKVVKLNKVYCAGLVEKCVDFWNMHVFKRIIMDEN